MIMILGHELQLFIIIRHVINSNKQHRTEARKRQKKKSDW